VGPLRKTIPHEYARFKKAYERANCFCLLSELDAYGIVLLEAQLSGTPVIALDRGSRAEVVKHGRTGLLVGSATPRAVAQALIAILADPIAARQMGAAGHEFVARNFTWSAVADRILRHIAETVLSLAA
jgi:glycosyltransferase involved in cell wall biosynthesis